MPFICPRDKSKLNRFDHSFDGKWSCSSCSGSFAIEKRIRKLAMGEEFLRDVSSRQEATSLLNCPSCYNKMAAVFIELPNKTELDRCHDCELIWFDRDELKSLETESDARSALSMNPMRNVEDQRHAVHLNFGKVLIELNDFGGLKRWERYSRAIRIGNALIVVAAVVVALSTYQFESEYRPAISVGRTQSSSPLGYALSTTVLALISSLRPRLLWQFSLLALLSLYQALLTWLARY